MLVLGAVSAVGNLGLLGQAAQAPFAALGLMYNALLAWKVNKETFGYIDILSSFIICSGIAVAVAFASLDDETYTLSKLMDMYTSMLAIIYFCVMFSLLTSLNLLVRLLQKTPQQKDLSTDIEKDVVDDVGVLESIDRLQSAHPTIGGSQVTLSSKVRAQALGLVSFSLTSGILSGTTGLCVKTVIEVIKSCINEDLDDWKRAEFWVFAFLIPVSLCGQLYFMNLGLKAYDALQFVPCYQSSIVLANYLSGTIFFQEYEGRDAQNLILQALGIVIVLLGVLVLLQKPPSSVHWHMRIHTVMFIPHIMRKFI